jgi:hypothetical protein
MSCSFARSAHEHGGDGSILELRSIMRMLERSSIISAMILIKDHSHVMLHDLRMSSIRSSSSASHEAYMR